MQRTDPTEAEPSTTRRWVSPRALLNATGFLSLLAVGAGTALLLPPARVAGDLPGPSELGQLAPTSIKANRDYIIPDPAATQALRDEAARAVRPVYDFDAPLAEQATERIERAFAYMRGVLDAAADPRKPDRASDQPGAAMPHHAEFLKLLQAVVDEAEFRELAQTGFAPEVERAAELLVRGLLGGELAASRELLLAERADGITVRTLGPTLGGRNERHVRDVERIADLPGVRHDLKRLSQGLPEAPGSVTGLGRIALALPSELSPQGRRAAALLAHRVVAPNLTYNERETRARQLAASEAVKPVVLQYARGERIIGDGERIEARHLLVFRSMLEQARMLDTVQVRLGAALFAMLLSLSIFRLARRTVRRFRPSKRDLVFLTAALLGNLALVRGVLALSELLRDRVPALTPTVAVFLVPVAAGPMLVRLVRSGEASVVFALVCAPLIALQTNAFEPALVGLLASMIAANRLALSGARENALVLAGAQAGGAAALATGALALFGSRLLQPETMAEVLAAALGSGLLSPIAAALVAPLVEALFGYATQKRLHKLANLNHPVLKELIIRAPGTYHHSLLVGDLAAAAAERIDANALLARVGGYFHDLGKAEAPLMFSENQRTENRLDHLPPEEAAQVLKRHIEAGLEMAARARLPRAVTDAIAQHHGRARTSNFYEQALALAANDPQAPPLDERRFRYDGPTPRSREVALVMLADVVEAASRKVAHPSPEAFRALVPQAVEPLLLSGELDDCDLTLAELHQVVEALGDALVKVHGIARSTPPPDSTSDAPSPRSQPPPARALP